MTLPIFLLWPPWIDGAVTHSREILKDPYSLSLLITSAVIKKNMHLY